MSERKIDTFLQKQVKVGKMPFTWLDICFVAVIWVLALVARLQFYPIVSGDYYGFLSKWMAQIQQYGAWNSLATRISDYSAPYMYLMCLVSWASNPMYALKTISVIFDFIASIAMFMLVQELTGDKRKSIFGMTLVLFCPTVMMNSAWWCQCDSIYCTFILFALYFFFKDKSALCCIFLGIAFSFKVQTVFILPFIVMMWLKNRTIKLAHLLYIPLVFFVMQIPAWIAGRPILDLLGIYFTQAGEYPYGTLRYPNIYEFFDETMLHKHHQAEVGNWGLFFSLGIIGLLAYYICDKKFKLDDTLMVTLALFSVCTVLYTMPHMHERYGYLVDLLVIVYALQRPGKAWVSALYILLSMITYMRFLQGIYLLPFYVLAAVMLGLNIYVGYDLYAQIRANSLPGPKPGK